MAKKEVVEEAVEWYKKNRGLYRDLAVKIESIIKEMLVSEDIFYHSLESRAKTVNSFKRKAKKDKYEDPLTEITDLTGIRVITYFEKDVYKICDIIKELFKIDYSNSEDKSDLLEADRMGYKSVHYIATFTQERTNLSEFKHFEDLFFEIQVRSILQHAWAEIEHDRNYKFKGDLPQHLQRRFYSLAGMLEMADREFNSLTKEVANYKEKVTNLTQDGAIDLEINPTSLKEYLSAKFSKAIKESILRPTFGKDDSNAQLIITELQKYGINNLVELDSILPKKLTTKIKLGLEKSCPPNFISLVRLIMVINDHRKYFEKVWEDKFGYFYQTSANILQEYNIPIEKLAKEYNFSIKENNGS